MFAIVPAAGQSLRMGDRHKLLLRWNDRPLIDHLLQAWTDSVVDHVVVVVRSDDDALQHACRRWPVDLVVPDHDPADMKRSIQLGLSHVRSTYHPSDSDCWMMAPADLPTLTSELINRVAARAQVTTDGAGPVPEIVVPRFGVHQGHPVLLRWTLVEEVFALGEDQGVDQVVARHDVCWLDLPQPQRLVDVDTPEDFDRLKADPRRQ